MELNKYIDHTLLKPEATKKDIENLCAEAKKFRFATVCINPVWISTAKDFLKGSAVKITTVVGFPLGANTTETKVYEAQQAIANGVDEIDMVLNIGRLKAKDYDVVLNDLQAVRKATTKKILKVILETCLLSDAEIVQACQLAVQAKVDFVKTSTGFNRGGATPEIVKLMKETVKTGAQVKAAGGIRTTEDALRMIENGATRLGTSNGVTIIKNQHSASDY